jgi:hypothetical protein
MHVVDYPYLDRAETERFIAIDDDIWNALQDEGDSLPANEESASDRRQDDVDSWEQEDEWDDELVPVRRRSRF